MKKTLAILVLLLTACTSEQAGVVRVIDGDTLVAARTGGEVTVRLIGINAPEHDECYGSEATLALRQLVEGQSLTLVPDADPTDRFGRALAYVYADDVFVNRVLVERGFALARPYTPNTAHQSELQAAMRRAQKAQLGMWGPSACGPASSAVQISAVDYNPPGPDGQALNDESVTIRNDATSPVDVSHWILRDASSTNRFEIPSGFVVPAGRTLVIHTGCGQSNSSNLYWCADVPIWNNDADVAILYDDSGALVSSFTYAQTRP